MITDLLDPGTFHGIKNLFQCLQQPVTMLLLKGVLLPCFFHFCTLILNRSGFLNPFSLILHLLLQLLPFVVDAFEMAVRPFYPVIQKSGYAEDQGTLHHYIYNLLIQVITVVDKAYLGHYTYATIVYKWRLV